MTDHIQSEKKPKPMPKKRAYAVLRIRRETQKQIATDLERLNRKDFGRRIRAEDYLALLVTLITPQLLEGLQESTLTHADRLERDYRAYVAQHGPISKDEYLGMRLSSGAAGT